MPAGCNMHSDPPAARAASRTVDLCPLVGPAVRLQSANLDYEDRRIDSSRNSSLADEPVRFRVDFNYRSSVHHARLATTRGSLRNTDNSPIPSLPCARARPLRWRVHTSLSCARAGTYLAPNPSTLGGTHEFLDTSPSHRCAVSWVDAGYLLIATCPLPRS